MFICFCCFFVCLQPGAVLIFVPGWSDIKAVNDKIEQKLSKSSISKSKQNKQEIGKRSGTACMKRLLVSDSCISH